MSLFSWLFSKPGYIRFDDTFALDQEALWEPICDSVRQETAAGRKVLLIAHFTDMFTQLQEQLETRDLPYDVVTHPLDEKRLAGLVDEVESVFLVLAELLPDPETISSTRKTAAQTSAAPVDFALIICDRHPLYQRDARIAQLAKALPEKTRLGYFLALDDVVVRRAIGDTTVELLEQLGLGKRESLVASNVVSRRLNVIQKRTQANMIDEKPADNAAEWYALNLKENAE